VGGEMSLNCATLSYNGVSYFGFSGDVHAAPDLQKLGKFVQASFIELQHAAGIRPPRKKKARAAKTAKPREVKLRAAAAAAAAGSASQSQAQPSTTLDEQQVPVPLAAD